MIAPWLLDLLLCPTCRGEERLREEGETLVCPTCDHRVPVARGIPRFVAAAENYAEGFGWQWNRWRTLQVDRLADHPLSERRFLADSRWDPDWFKGKLILDAGCGAGRFADVAAQLGARVVACDLSGAIDAAQANCEEPKGRSLGRGEVALMQANVLNLPFRPSVFDAIYCMGVIQHTPNPEAVMRSLPVLLKPGGQLAYNFYERSWLTHLEVVKYVLRCITPGWDQKRLLGLCESMVRLFFPLTRWMSSIPKVRFFVRFIPICATHPPELNPDQQYEWTVLDTFDWLNPHYEIRQDHREVAELLRGMGMVEVDSAPGLAWSRRPETRGS